MKVLILDLGNEMRGGQRQVLYLAGWLTQQAELRAEFSAVLACPASSPLYSAALEQCIPLLPLKGRRFWNPFVYLQIKAYIKNALAAGGVGAKILIHTNDAHAAALGALLSKNDPRVLLMHTRRVSYPLNSGRRAAKYKAAGAIAAVSAEIGEALAQGGVNREKIRVIHSGIDPATYTLKNNTQHERFRFAIVGALTEQKGHGTLVRALLILKDNPAMLPFEVLAAGKGHLLESLTAQIKELGVEGLITFLGQKESRALLPDCDAVLSPSSGGEGSNATIKEAWAVGLPVIASDLPSNLELVRPGESGLAFGTGNAEELAAAMFQVATDRTLYDKLVQGGTERLPGFTSQRMCESYVDWYRELAKV